jgi:hypothetical protein
MNNTIDELSGLNQQARFATTDDLKTKLTNL